MQIQFGSRSGLTRDGRTDVLRGAGGGTNTQSGPVGLGEIGDGGSGSCFEPRGFRLKAGPKWFSAPGRYRVEELDRSLYAENDFSFHGVIKHRTLQPADTAHDWSGCCPPAPPTSPPPRSQNTPPVRHFNDPWAWRSPLSGNYPSIAGSFLELALPAYFPSKRMRFRRG